MATDAQSGYGILGKTTDSKGRTGHYKYNAAGKLVFVADQAASMRDSGVANNPAAASAPPSPASVSTDAPASAADPNAWWQDSTYNTTAGPGGTIQTGLANLKTYLGGAAKKTASDLGVTVTGDPLGDPSQVSYSIDDNVDVTNPFSRAALLKRSYQQHQAGNTNSMAARGQLYSGALQNAQNETTRQNLQGQDALTKQAGDTIGGYYGQWLGAQQSAGQQGIDAAGAAASRNANTPADPALAAPVSTPAAAVDPTHGQKTKVKNGQRFRQRPSDGKWIPY